MAKQESVARDMGRLLSDNDDNDNERTAKKGRRWRVRLAVSLKCEWTQLATVLAGDDVVVAGGGFGLTVGETGERQSRDSSTDHRHHGVRVRELSPYLRAGVTRAF